MVKNSLYHIHEALGCTFVEFDGILVPNSYGNREAEWRYVRESVGLFDAPYLALSEMTGEDRVRFLQGMVSNDVAGIPEGQGTYATVLTTQGKIVSDLRIFRTEQSFLLLSHRSGQQKVVSHLERHLIADEVEIQGRTGEAFLGLQGPESARLVGDLGLAVPEKEYSHVCSEIDVGQSRHSLVCFRVSLAGGEGVLISLAEIALVPVWNRILQAVKSLGGGSTGLDALWTSRMEAGIPLYGVDFDSAHFPLEAGLDRVVSQSKGCYLGQEVVERIRARGHVNRRIVMFHLDGKAVPARGTKVFIGNRQVGEITSGTFSVAFGCPVAFGYVHRDSACPGTEVRIGEGGQAPLGTIASLPGV